MKNPFWHYLKLSLIISLCCQMACSQPHSVLTSYDSLDRQPTSFNSFSSKNPQTDREFKIKNFEKESFTDKTGYVVLGLVIAAASVAAVVVPIVILKN